MTKQPDTPNAPQLRWTAFIPDDLNTEWMRDGLCLKIGKPDDWFPEMGQAHEAAEAMATCYQCPVRTQCLDYAMTIEVNQDGSPLGASARCGIYGGLTGSARARVAKGGDPAPPRETPEERSTRAKWRNTRVLCPDCGQSVTKGSLARHRKRRHEPKPDPMGRLLVGPDCGTEKGYQRHYYVRDHWPLPADDPCGCRAAHTQHERDRTAA